MLTLKLVKKLFIISIIASLSSCGGDSGPKVVTDPPPPVVTLLPKVTLTVNPSTVASNGSSTLSWSGTNVTSCIASGDWSGDRAVTGSETINSISSSRHYTLTCTGDKGSASDSAQIVIDTGLIKAFPTAEGFGAKATGGRSGQIIKVTTLAASGAGSFQAALNIDAPRIILFNVSGVIEGDVNIPYGNVTIAGQTAPGAGITIHGRLECDYGNAPDNIIIRHIRVRADHSTNSAVNGNQYDGVQCSTSSNLIFDHVSVSGGVDENFDIYSAKNVTVQWSSITRSDPNGHNEGNHNYGLISGPNGSHVSIHHNLFAHNLNRNPAIANGPSEVINNVVYNVRHGFIHHNPATGLFNIIGNYYKQGLDNTLIPFFFDDENAGAGNPSLSYFLTNNYIDDPGDHTGTVNNPWQTPFSHSSFEGIDWGWDSSNARTEPMHDFDSVKITTHSADSNYELVLNEVGAFPRDSMLLDDVQEVRDRTGRWGVRIPSDLMSGLTVSSILTDTDNDGLPDEWETSHNLSTTQPDSWTEMPSGYYAIEQYINELAQSIIQ